MSDKMGITSIMIHTWLDIFIIIDYHLVKHMILFLVTHEDKKNLEKSWKNKGNTLEKNIPNNEKHDLQIWGKKRIEGRERWSSFLFYDVREFLHIFPFILSTNLMFERIYFFCSRSISLDPFYWTRCNLKDLP